MRTATGSMVSALNQLTRLPLKGGVVVAFCPACGEREEFGNRLTQCGELTDYFKVFVAVCSQCGHIYGVDIKTKHYRNLTNDEKRRLPKHPAAEAIREFQNQIVERMVG